MIKKVLKMYNISHVKVTYPDTKTRVYHTVKYSILPYIVIALLLAIPLFIYNLV